jgi:SlyX protein
MEPRINELEARFTQQEQVVAELSEVVWKQQQEIDRLTRIVIELQQKLAGDPGLVDANQHEKPPHY